MLAFPTPVELYERAVRLWKGTTVTDPRSELHQHAEDAIVHHSIEPVRQGVVRALRWIRALHRHEQFWRDHGHSPREKTRNMDALPDSERVMGEWARYQRRTKTQLSTYQLIRLDISPSFQWDPQHSTWISNLQACERHRRATGSLPRLNSKDPEEFALARWLGRQFLALRMGTLPRQRADQLHAVLGGTGSDTPAG